MADFYAKYAGAFGGGGGGGGTGDVVGPASSTDEAVARFSGTTGKLLQDSVVIISDTGATTGITSLNASGTATVGQLIDSGLTASTVPYANASKQLTSSAVTPTELGYVSGVTSSIQAQLDGKQATGNYITALTGDVTAAGPGSSAATLATVNSNVGSFTYSSITVNAKGLITAASSGAAPTGTVTDVSVVSANGLAGSVATSTTTPAITLSTTVTGILSGNGTAISAASTTGSGAVVLATSPTLVTPLLGTPTSGVLTNCTGLPVAGGGTGQSSYTNGQLLIGNTTGNTLDKATLTQGTGITVTNGGGSITIAATGVGLVEALPGMIETPADKIYVLDQSAAYAYTINTLIIATASGTCTAAVKINGTDVTGISAVSVSSTPATGTASAANSVSVGNKVTLVISSNATAADLSFTLKVTRS